MVSHRCLPSWGKRGKNTLSGRCHPPTSPLCRHRGTVPCPASTSSHCSLPGSSVMPLEPALPPAWEAIRAGKLMTTGTAPKQWPTGVHVHISLPVSSPFYTNLHNSLSRIELQLPRVVPSWQFSIHWSPVLPSLVPLLCSLTGSFTFLTPKQIIFVRMPISQIRKLKCGECKPPLSMNTALPGCGALATGHA